MPTVAEEAVAQMFTESIPEAALASAVLRKLSHGQIREAAYAWILACISDERRVRELRAQAGARAEIRRKTRERANAAGFSTVTEMKSTHLRLGALLDKSFRIGTGEKLSWAKATVTQHESRVEYMRKLQHGYEKDINDHLTVIALLRSTGAPDLETALKEGVA